MMEAVYYTEMLVVTSQIKTALIHTQKNKFLVHKYLKSQYETRSAQFNNIPDSLIIWSLF